MPKLHISKEELVELYINQKMSINTISKKYNCDFRTIKKRLEEYNIPTRSRREATKKYIDPNLIMEKINEGMFVYQVAEFFGVNRKTITKNLIEAGIDVTQLESHQKLMEENNSRTSKEMWANDTNRMQEHMERLKEINEKKSEKAQLRYETAHLKDIKEYKRACTRIVDQLYGTERPEGMQIDHKYSIHDGFLNGVPAPILSHPFNLRWITAEENNSKGIGSIITLKQLYKGTGQKWDDSIKEIKTLTRNCGWCGTEFPYTNQHKNKRFCQRSCYSKWRYHNNNKQ